LGRARLDNGGANQPEFRTAQDLAATAAGFGAFAQPVPIRVKFWPCLPRLDGRGQTF
jgi:hypothetical protein